jgi:hypothetical protein
MALSPESPAKAERYVNIWDHCCPKQDGFEAFTWVA